ncbi:CCR4-NOT transcription complex subunit 7/8 [Cryptococcus neoformans]|uniref:poly(A)-specific ribonuclease n=3 Tax=Cryptococcus neoformans species complex TaxID=1897064 RepID=A0A854QGB7_CRYNE|nr:CCR4-NOT transcription complex subunit 7/8 [Cryptococcus neoformans var. grubii H99]AUB24094.1 CCR4-NOT transcription complex subunit 7/8 [Cryptococcus neoformans var. grubii]OWT40572.1 CCR4-NOT transcription complex subunit 7/8 [Cryptococcus neoformans var. grubii Bt1]OWZ33554.1 CCR4-NOT transcription complex subunit 7/8 [Cryptococcus neoformans var. grubii AD2-60a]OWZ45650.1 CCR4-NOT transcription complex subunit 7/8 [Cryptococcus neoformans var. grubii C23]OWZ47441.1 CCR4-NOT transcripti|eukprot:XP_012048529.1 CCR4-NOT transcription complex subunit 7/8 [Cryptococcus neoformans var. grubii H99]
MPSALLTMPQQEQLPSKDYGIREIWADNLESEFAALRQAVERYPYISMDTEFPGIVARPIGNFKTGSDYHFQTMRCNVDMLKIIQLGITLCDENGDSPEVSTWQFNFAFSLGEDMFAPDSIDLLKSSGIDFKRNEEEGIDVEYFGELLITSGLVLFDNIKWVSFHSGYDFGYLLKILTCEPLPADETDFFRLLFIWFPCIYDIKHIVRSIKTLRGGLQEIAESLGVKRIGPQHQAGSDSLLTAAVFFRIQTIYFDGHLNDDYYKNYLYGFSSGRLGKASPAAAGENLVDKPY